MSLEDELQQAYRTLQYDLRQGTRGEENSYRVYHRKVANAIDRAVEEGVRKGLSEDRLRQQMRQNLPYFDNRAM